MSRTFWQGRRVLVTGHTGFKGAWLTLWLSRLGADITGYALPPSTEPSLYDEAGVEGDCRSLFGDVRDRDRVWNEMRKAHPEVVFHLAAQPLVRASYADPHGTFDTNVMGTVNVLDAVRDVPGVKAVVVVTSDKCYANDGSGLPFAEGAPLGGDDPYSASKACAEIVTAAYRASFMREAPAIATARAGNVIGGGDWAPERLVPDIVSAVRAKMNVELRFPEAVRPWQHVLEPVYAYVQLAERLAERACESSAYNFGPSHAEVYSVAALAENFLTHWGGRATWHFQQGSHPREHSTLMLDTSRATQLLGIRARLDFPDTVRWTADWYRRFDEGEDARALCLEQIGVYEGLA